ncbi:hypothetical protein X801_05701 [Opisthorchis viverrini]|uniref:Uncharacterized protein n=1 Tax=Opisthorchis viverrini TaxID=6198 RepID=A0A1S8WVJ2_OPIVI|nr:hypothetical protein X801_05701 [Opisthorchis viverrini]
MGSVPPNSELDIQGGGGGYQPPGPPMGSMPPYSTPQGMPAMPSMPGTIGFGGFADAPPQYSPQPQAPAYGSYQQQPGYNSGPAYNYPTGSYCQPQVPLAPAATYGGGGAYPRQPPPPPGQTSYYTPPSAGQQFVGSNGQPYEVVYVGGKPKKKKLLKNAAVGMKILTAACRTAKNWALRGPPMQVRPCKWTGYVFTFRGHK